MRTLETAANTWTETQWDTPTALIGKNKLQAMEIMAIRVDAQSPSLEAGQDNYNTWQITTQSFTSQQNITEDDVLLSDAYHRQGVEVTAVGEIYTQEKSLETRWDMTDGDGNGTLVTSKDLYLGVVGIGNASARYVNARVIYHLVEVDADELIQAALSD